MAEGLADRQEAAAPGAELGEDGDERDRLLGQAVDRALLVAGVGGAG